jgi:hypothetical protein
MTHDDRNLWECTDSKGSPISEAEDLQCIRTAAATHAAEGHGTVYYGPYGFADEHAPGDSAQGMARCELGVPVLYERNMLGNTWVPSSAWREVRA